jgi:hypothetical protein
MAIFEASARRKPGTRSNTALVKSGGMSPAGQWITDPNLPIRFFYDYGGPGQKEVVVPKGYLVGVAPQRYKDDALGFYKNALTIATDTIRPFGVAPYNFTKHWEDFLDGNQPSVITRDYIELPWFPNKDDAAAHKWGAVNGPLAPNDLVTWSRDPATFGQFIKWDPAAGHSPADIIGQVGEIEDDQEIYGWLKWVMWDEAARRQDQDGPVNKSGYSAPTDGGYPFDPEYKRLGKTGENGYFSQYYTTPNDASGIPGLTDGRQRAETVHSMDYVIQAGTAANTVVQFNLGKKNIINGSTVVLIDGVEPPANSWTIDLTNGIVSYTVPSNVGANQNVNIKFRCEFFGTPAHLDFKGVRAAVRILLKF